MSDVGIVVSGLFQAAMVRAAVRIMVDFFIMCRGLKWIRFPLRSGMTITSCRRFRRGFLFPCWSITLLPNKVPALGWPEIDTVFLP